MQPVPSTSTGTTTYATQATACFSHCVCQLKQRQYLMPETNISPSLSLFLSSHSINCSKLLFKTNSKMQTYTPYTHSAWQNAANRHQPPAAVPLLCSDSQTLVVRWHISTIFKKLSYQRERNEVRTHLECQPLAVSPSQLGKKIYICPH